MIDDSKRNPEMDETYDEFYQITKNKNADERRPFSPPIKQNKEL